MAEIDSSEETDKENKRKKKPQSFPFIPAHFVCHDAEDVGAYEVGHTGRDERHAWGVRQEGKKRREK